MFGLDDLPWSTGPLSVSEIEDIISSLSDRIDSIILRSEVISAHETIYELPRIARLTLANILFEMPDISNSVRIRAQRLIDRIPTFFDEEIPIEIHWSDTDWIAPTTAWVGYRTQKGESVACITANGSNRHEAVAVVLSGNEIPVWFISDESSHVKYFRNLAKNPHCDEAEFANFASHAFPNLAFVENVFHGLNDLKVTFNQRRDEIIFVLSALSDHSTSIFSSQKEKEISDRLKALSINASTENRETLKNLKCRTARQRKFESQILIFDWHIKFEPHIDRLHFHPPVPQSKNRPIIGIFHSHLPLPND